MPKERNEYKMSQLFIFRSEPATRIGEEENRKQIEQRRAAYPHNVHLKAESRAGQTETTCSDIKRLVDRAAGKLKNKMEKPGIHSIKTKAQFEMQKRQCPG